MKSFWESVAKYYEPHHKSCNCGLCSGRAKWEYENNASAGRLPDSEPAQQTRALDRDSARETPSSKHPLVRFGLCRTRLLDVDAKYGSVKDLLDGLAYAGLIHGDREDQITLEVYQIKVAHIEDEQTIIEIDY